MTEINNDYINISIEKSIPHRYPMLLVDKVLGIKPRESIIAQKNVSHNEWFFAGHFPGNPVMPGVLIIEAIAQTAILLMHNTVEVDWNQQSIYLTNISSATFRKRVVPGDILQIEVFLLKQKGLLWKMKGIGKVENDLVVETEFAAALVNRKE